MGNLNTLSLTSQLSSSHTHTLCRNFSLLTFLSLRFSRPLDLRSNQCYVSLSSLLLRPYSSSFLSIPVLRLPKRHPTAMASSKDPQSNIPASSKSSWSSFLKVSVQKGIISEMPVMYSLRSEICENSIPAQVAYGITVLLRCQPSLPGPRGVNTLLVGNEHS